MATLAQPPQGVSTGSHLDNRRMTAALIDLVVPVAIGAAAYAAGLSLTRGVLLVVVGWTLYYFFALESGDGQTLGKRVMKLRVVSADGSTASMEQIAKRTVVRILDGHIVGLIVMLATGERRQRLGDIVAGTVVTEAATDIASEATTAQLSATEPAAHLTPVPSDEPAAESLPWHKRSLKLPALSKPSFSKSKRSLSMPSLRRRSRPEDEVLSQTSAHGPASMPAPMQADPVAEVEAFDPFAEPDEVNETPETHAGPEPIEEFMEREVTIELEPAVAFDDEAAVTLEDDHFGESDEREYDRQLEDAREPAVEVEGAEPGPQHDETQTDGDAEERLAERTTIKPIETVSAIDLVMQDAEDRHPGSR